MSEASLVVLGVLAPDSVIDVRRFRPNIVLGGVDQGFGEDEWVGHRIRIGTVVARVEIRTMRCVMVTRAFADLPSDRTIMRTLVRRQVVPRSASACTPLSNPAASP